MKGKIKNTFRRLLGVLAAIAMVLGMSVGTAIPAMAEGNGGTYTITVNNAQSGATYSVYKLFDATVNTNRASQTDAGETSEVMTDGINYTLPTGKSLDTSYTYTTTDSGISKTHTVTGNTWFSIDTAGNITAKENADLTTRDFQEWAKAFAGSAAIDSKKNEGESVSTIVFNNLTSGYYFVTSTTGSLVTVTSIAPNAIIKDKNTAPDVNKTENVKTSGVGDTVTYTVEVSIPTGTTNLVFHDKMGTGLTLSGTIDTNTDLTAENSPLKVQVNGSNLTKTTDYTVDYWSSTDYGTAGVATNTTSANEDNITISFTSSYLTNLTAQTTVVLTYAATVNESAVVNMPNGAYVTYGSNQSSTEKTVYESSFGFVINKVDASNNNASLSGAKFALSTSNNLTNLTEESTENLLSFDDSGTLVTTGGTKVRTASNSLTFKGLNDNNNNSDVITYYLYEITAPDGYNKLTGPIEIQFVPRFNTNDTITHGTQVTGYTLRYKLPGSNWEETNTSDTDVTVAGHNFNVPNTQGILLPSTGGIGTTIFYVVGGILIAGAVVLLVARRKRNA